MITCGPVFGEHRNPDQHGIRVLEYDGAARLVTMRDTVAQGCQGCDPYKYREDHAYDASGNEEWRWSDEWDVQSGGGSVYDQAVSYFGADQKLWVFNRVIGIDSISNDVTPGRRGVYEEYRYDALGRRVFKRTRHDSACPTNDGECASVAERTIWDGDQILYEIRSHGHDTVSAYSLDRDDDWSTSTEAYAYGRVVYTHAGGIDQPLGIIRMGMNQQPDPWVIFPHANWRGSFEGGSNVNGTVCWGTGGGCLIPWPGRGTTADGELAQPSLQAMWFGNLVSGKTDGSGLQYMRNRYYDPKTGRFTQEDPIELAGGVNLYGFADGDPVNNSDPFGLQACDPPGSCRARFLAAGTAVGTAGGVLVAGGCTVGSGGVCALGAPALVTGGAALGATVGGLAGEIAENAPAIASGLNTLLAKGLSWWDKLKIKIAIVIGTAATEGELESARIERERARQEQVEQQKADQNQSGEGGKPPEP